MSWLGKFIGAVIGWLFFRHPLGALFGVGVGHMIDSGAFGLRPLGTGGGAPRGFIEPLFALLGAISKADGRVSEAEIAAVETLMARMRLDPVLRRRAIETFNAGKESGFPVHLAIADLKAWTQGRRDHAYILIDLVLDIVGAEGQPAGPKFALLKQMAWTLRVDERELAALAAMKGFAWGRPGGDEGRHAPPPRGTTAAGPEPYWVLGLPQDAAEGEIKRAYRKLMSEHHPDKLGDVPDALRQRAEERAREINAAYERIKSARGFK